MERLTTDNSKDNIQAALNLFYIKDRETFVRGGGPAPGYADISLFDFTRQIIKTHIPDENLSIDDDSLSMMMGEWLFDGPETTEGLIALMYTSAWAFSELRHRLAAYEDTGLEPDTVSKIRDIVLDISGDIDHLRELVQAEKDGRLVVLPCFPDETYWQMHGDVPAVSRFDGICIIDSDMNLFYQINGDNVNAKDIGKTVFLTREEEEEEEAAALKGEANETDPV